MSEYYFYFQPKSMLDEPDYLTDLKKKVLYVIDKIILLVVESSNVSNMLEFATTLSFRIKKPCRSRIKEKRTCYSRRCPLLSVKSQHHNFKKDKFGKT